ncbi:hypothetical protein AB1K62_11310 [Parasphingorhabdus sp. JC815]|uniref:hypothetical protein n=1 Tax=Parasphingorhabdus sp. JC815 TaxID=3232140 RepID=UPI00345B4BFF
MSLSLFASLLLVTPVTSELPVADPPVKAQGVYVGATEHEYAQVRIEKRVIIRVPRRRPVRSAIMADFAESILSQRYKEKKIGKCLPMNNILGVRGFGDRHLDLVSKNNQMVRVRLKKKCQGRSFYSGFYMEKSDDGKICSGRDILHSRTGAKCEIDRFRLLVPE